MIAIKVKKTTSTLNHKPKRSGQNAMIALKVT